MYRAKIEEILKKETGEKGISLDFPEREEFGDFATSIALVLVKKEGNDPKSVAEGLVDKLRKNDGLREIIEKIEVAGPGFINFFLSQKALLENLQNAQEENYGSSDMGAGKTVLVEYSSPNIAKSFGVGHLRSTIIGQALFNLFRALGYQTVSENHLGDWGTQFGAILAQIANLHLAVSDLSVEKLEELYVDFNKKARDDPKLWDEARGWFKKLEEGDSEAKQIWEAVRKISFEEFERIYKRLGVSFENMHGESFYQDKMPAVLEEARAKGLSKKSEGAEIVEFPKMPPAMLVKSDGTTTYFTRDLATAKYRVETWNPEVLIYEVGSDQILHLRQVFETARLLGWAEGRQFVHVAHGLIRFQGGKMSTRAGQSIKLEGVLNEAVKRAREIIEKSETGRGLSEDEKEKVSEMVGIGAIKYFDLMHHPQTDIIFDWDKIFVLEGNSGPYLQYTYARTNSVLAKVKDQNSLRAGASGRVVKTPNLEIGDWKLEINPEELLVLRSLVRFSDVIASSAKNYSPNLLANYLFELAQKYNNFYNQHRIIGGENEEFRSALTFGVGGVLKKGLGLLGIDTPERM